MEYLLENSLLVMELVANKNVPKRVIIVKILDQEGHAPIKPSLTVIVVNVMQQLALHVVRAIG